jgi:aerobic carbon-monoxide dehydrogenase large subunit
MSSAAGKHISAQQYIGRSVPRKEDPRLLRGEGTFVDDIQLHGMVHAAILRSPHAHARIRNLNTNASGFPEVLTVLTYQDIAGFAKPIPMRLEPTASFRQYLQFPLAARKVRYVGEPVAVVVAGSRYAAEDALDRIEVEYEPLPAVADMPGALAPEASLVHESTSSNLAGSGIQKVGDVEAAFLHADLILKENFTVQRHSGFPMETRGLVAEYDRGTGVLTVWGPTKVPHFNVTVLSSFLGLPEHRIHFLEPDVGGGFGIRGEFYPEDFLIPHLTISLGRPVKWIEDRREHFLAANHSRGQRWQVEIATENNGTLLGIRAEVWNDMGAYIRTHGATVPAMSAAMFPGPYRVPNYECQWHAVITNKTPIGTYRSPGRYECNFVRERLMDMIAHRLGIDPVDVRLRNFVQPGEMPYRVGTNVLETPVIYDSGDYPGLMRKAIEVIGYDQLRKEPHQNVSSERVGMGFGYFVEKTGSGPFEEARVRIDRSGKAIVYTGATSLGQGLETVLSQICAEELGLNIEDVTVIHGDTFLSPRGVGTFASRATILAGSAVLLAARKVKEKILRMASGYFQCSETEIQIADSCAFAADGTSETLPLAELIRRVSSSWDGVVSGLDLEANHYFEVKEMAFPHGLQVARVRVDVVTGSVTVEKLWSFFDVGRAINPALVEGQILGGIAQGIGGALLEELAYDEQGQLLCTSFMDYLMPSSTDMPPVEVHIYENDPSPLNPLGVKGAGEGGTAAVGGAIGNAVSDALKEFGIEITDLPLSPNRLFEIITKSQRNKPIAASP